MRFSLVPFLLLGIPLLEIAAFIAIGSQIGVLPTLGMVVVTAVIGSILLRIQGFGLVTRIREEMDRGRLPDRELVHGVMILLAGVLLLTPGFVTDTFGFLLFVPPIRDAAWRFLRERVVAVSGFGPQAGPGFGPGFNTNGGWSRDGNTVDLDPEDYGPAGPDPDPDRRRLERN